MSIKLNGETIPVTRFPDNTTQVWKLPERLLTLAEAVIEWDYSYEGEFFEIAQLKDLLESYGCQRLTLFIDYLPFARQDKVVTNVSTFALHSFAKLLNALEFDEVIITDPHSKVATELINDCVTHYPFSRVSDAIRTTNSSLLCYPDSGALDKYSKVYKHLDKFYIYGEKVRDQETGYITSYTLHGQCHDARVLIVDDICDGGKTFEILAKDLYAAGAKEVNLFVTHGIFSKGLRDLEKAGIYRFFTKKGEAFWMPGNEVGYKNEI